MNFLWKTVNLLLIFLLSLAVCCALDPDFVLLYSCGTLDFCFLSDFTADSGFLPVFDELSFVLSFSGDFLDPSLVGACPFGSFGDSVLFSFSLDLFSAFSVGVFLSIFGFGLVFDAFSNFSLTALFLGLLSGFGLFLGSFTGVDDLAFA